MSDEGRAWLTGLDAQAPRNRRCLLDFLVAAGRGDPIAMATPTTSPAPKWMRDLAEVLIWVDPPAALSDGMVLARAYLCWLRCRRPGLLKRKLN